MMKRTFKTILLCMTALSLLSACGVKPGSVEPPEGGKDSGFPHQYPDITTAPRPYTGPVN